MTSSCSFLDCAFFSFHSHVLTRASDPVHAKGPPTRGSAPQTAALPRLHPQMVQIDMVPLTVIQGCAKGDHGWPPCGLLNWKLFFINSSPVCIFKHQKGPGLGFSSVCVDHLDTNNCRRIPDKELIFLFYFLGLRTGRLSWRMSQWSFSTGLFSIGNVSTIWVQFECHYRGPVGLQITYCAYQCNRDQVIVWNKS